MRLAVVSGIIILTAALAPFTWVAGQQFKLSPLTVYRSPLIAELKALRVREPKLPAADLANAANGLLARSGINFSLSLDALTCEQLRRRKAAQNDPSAPLKVSGRLASVGADATSVSLPEINFATKECSDCFVELPLLEITNETFVAVINERNIRFHLPSNFHANEVILADAADPRLIKKRWKVPATLEPIGISSDEKVLYLGFDEPELADLSLLVFSEGSLQIGTRAEAEDGGKGKPQTSATGSRQRTLRFDRWRKSFFIVYTPGCRG